MESGVFRDSKPRTWMPRSRGCWPLSSTSHDALTDVTAAAGILAFAPDRSTGASWADFDRDGDLDLFVARFGPFLSQPRAEGDPSTLYRNEGDGTFTDISDQLPALIQVGYTFIGGWFFFYV